MAAATAVSGLVRYSSALFVPERPRKFLLDVRIDTAFVWGDWLFPMQNPQIGSVIRAPADSRFANAPFLARFSSTCFEPGEITKLTDGWIFVPFSIFNV